MSVLDRLHSLVEGIATGSGMDGIRSRLLPDKTWPPQAVAKDWLEIEGWRRRYVNDRAEMLQHTPEINRSPSRAEIFTPVPLARDVARISSQLLFSETPRFAEENSQEDLDELIRENMLPSMLADAGEKVAVEGYGALRIIRDDETLDGIPIITYVPGDQVIWDIRHGRFVRGGVAVGTISEENQGRDVVWRLLESHEPGKVSRELYRGRASRIGDLAPLDSRPEFAGLEDEEATLPGVVTLVRWANTPNATSDIAGLDALLDGVSEGVTIGRDKMRKSVPKVFADRSLVDGQGRVDLEGVILTGGGNVSAPLGESAIKTVETSQPGLEADSHIAYIEHVVNLTIEMAGYSRSTWSRGEGGGADSGRALKLLMTRTLMTRANKDSMAKDAITKALAIALAWKAGGKPEDYTVEATFGDGLPDDPRETAEEIAMLKQAEAISTEEMVRMRHPDKDDEDVEEEAASIREENAGPQPKVPELDVGFGDLNGSREKT